MHNTLKKIYGFFIFLSLQAIIIISLDYSFRNIFQNPFPYDIYLRLSAYKSFILLQLSLELSLVLIALPIIGIVVLKMLFYSLSTFIIISPRPPPSSCLYRQNIHCLSHIRQLYLVLNNRFPLYDRQWVLSK